ncbi:MAG: sigma-54-dependent Fis family transcriptional regulator [Planctomycetota bacterium]
MTTLSDADETWLELVSRVCEADTEAAAADLVVPAVLRRAGAKAAAIVRADPPKWRVLAAAPDGGEVAFDLAADALDRGGPVAADGAVAAPLPSSETDVLCLTGAADATAAEELASRTAMTLRLASRLRGSRRRQERLETLLRITNSWRRTRDVRSLLEHMARAACDLFDADRASIFLWDKPKRQLVGRPALGVEGDELRVPDDAGVVGAVLQSRQPVRVAPGEDDAIDRSTDQKTGYQTESLLGVPLMSRGGDGAEPMGVFELLNKRAGDFTEDDERGLEELADYAAVALAETQELEQLIERHEQMVDEAASGVRLLGECAAIDALRTTIGRVADTDLAILILGENGSGKEVVAQLMHYQSSRRSGPFVAVNCAALAETLLESELFGHEQGAFTDAREARAGKFEIAAAGTLLLDEIGDLSLSGQAKLLRVLEEKTVVRVGGGVPIETDVRVLAATNRDLASLVREKKFREDLYFRLNVVSIDVPPLRRRGDDVMLLAKHFLTGFCRSMGRRTPKFTAAARKRVLAHGWPGNVRELRNLMERLAYLTSGDRIDAADLAFTHDPAGESEDVMEVGRKLTDATHQFQEEYIRLTIERNRGNVSQAAKMLGVHRSNLYRKMRSLGMASDDEEGDEGSTDSAGSSDERQ